MIDDGAILHGADGYKTDNDTTGPKWGPQAPRLLAPQAVT